MDNKWRRFLSLFKGFYWIKKEANAAKGAANPKTDVAGNLTIEQIIKIAKQKYDSLNSTNIKEAAKEIMGSCDSMGIHVEGLRAKDAIAELNAGKFDEKLK